MFKKVFLASCFISLLFNSISPNTSQTRTTPEEVIPFGLSFAPDQLIIKFRPEVIVQEDSHSTHVSSLDQALASINVVSLVPLIGLADTYVVKMQEGGDIQSAVDLLGSEPGVEYAEPDYLAEFASIPDDPRYSEQWGLSKIAVEGAWDQSMGSPSIVIAIIDSGIDLTHEDLAPNLWVNPGEVPGNSLDDDNNGFVDDVQGWNFVDSTNNVQDFIGHGSLVAGVAAARINNTVGIAGVCGNCHIMPVKVSQISGFANYSDIAAGVAYATQKGARVINISLGGYANSTTLRNVISTAVSQNIVVVAGAGNDNSSNPFYPAAYENVIAVAGTDQNDLKTSSSNSGPWVDVSAPGIDILSTTLGDYSLTSGTSFSAPFVSGAAGLLLTLHPEWTPAMIRSQFMHTTDDIDSLNPGYEGMLGTGRLNASLAMQEPQPILTYQSYTGNGVPNLRPDFGSSVSLSVALYNDWSDALGVTGSLSSSDGYVTITTSSASFGSILAGETKANSVPFSFDIASGAGYNHAMPFELALSANDGGYTTTLNFTITTRSSEEPVSGTIDSDTIWTNDKTYKVTGNVGVAPGFSLIIEPGTTIKFVGDYSLNIGGTLIAQGTAEQPIRFEPYTAGNTWGRIFFDDTSVDAQTTSEGGYQSGNILQYGALVGASSGIGCTSATPFLDNVTTNLGGMTCSLGATDLWLTNSAITGEVSITQGGSIPESVTGLQVSGGNVTLPPSAVMNSNFSGTLTVQGNGQVTNSAVGGVTINGLGNVQGVDSNGSISISSGQVLGSSAKGSINVGAGGTVSNCELSTGGINAGSGSTITHNNIENASGNGINTSGNSTVTFNRVVGAVQGIVASGGMVENNLVANTTGDGLHPGTASVRNNTFIGIEGNAVYLDSVPTSLENNNFEFNLGNYDVFVNVPNTVVIDIQAQNNWWGTTDIDLIKVRTWDYYDDYNLAKLITAPVLDHPSQTAPGYVRSVTLDPESPVGIQTVDFNIEFSKPMNTTITPQLTFRSIGGDTWTTRAPMPTPRYELGVAAASNGKIYAIGGMGGSNVVEEYDPLTDTWTTRSPMPTGRYGLGVAAASNGKIYAIGGSGGSNVVEEYDPLTDTWTTRSPMPTGRYGLGVAAASNGKIYAFGGLEDNEMVISYNVEEYTPPDWNSANITQNPEWLDSTHFRASYEISTLNPRGNYVVLIQNSVDSDNTLIIDDYRTTFTIDYAGEISDTTPPSQPQVLAWGNSSLTQLSAQAYANDTDSLIVGYRYAIGSTPGGIEVVNWTNISQNQVNHIGLSLLSGQPYYVSFQARNEAGLWSPIGISNPVINGATVKRIYLPIIRR